MTADGRRAVSASFDHTLKVWDLEGGRSIASFSTDGEARSCAMDAGGSTIVAGDATGSVYFLRLEEPAPG